MPASGCITPGLGRNKLRLRVHQMGVLWLGIAVAERRGVGCSTLPMRRSWPRGSGARSTPAPVGV